jgi:hypothetical protein
LDSRLKVLLVILQNRILRFPNYIYSPIYIRFPCRALYILSRVSNNFPEAQFELEQIYCLSSTQIPDDNSNHAPSTGFIKHPIQRSLITSILPFHTVCKIWGFHGGDYEEWCLLGCYASVALVRTDISEELSASFIRVTRIWELGTTLAVTSNRRTLRRNTKCFWPWICKQYSEAVITTHKRNNGPSLWDTKPEPLQRKYSSSLHMKI